MYTRQRSCILSIPFMSIHVASLPVVMSCLDMVCCVSLTTDSFSVYIVVCCVVHVRYAFGCLHFLGVARYSPCR